MSDLKPNKKVVLITGACGGLGQALTVAFRNDGWRVAAGQNQNRAFSESDDLHPVPLNVLEGDEINAAVQSTLSKWGQIDAVINNAGITADGPLLKMSETDWQRVIDINLKGAFLCSQAVIRTMFKQRDGHIINISSFAAKNGHLGQANYVAAKAGLIGLTQSLAKEGGTRNVCVNAVFPGVLDTPMTAELTEAQRSRIEETNVLGRKTNLNEVAEFILHLAQMKNVSGQVFQLDSRIGAWT